MLLTGAGLTVALVTTHIPLADVAKSLRSREIVRVGLLLENFLARRGGPRRIAVAGLNPHAGESGALGREEIEIIAPAIAQLNYSLATPERTKAHHHSSPARFHPTPFSTAPWRENSTPCFACITIRA